MNEADVLAAVITDWSRDTREWPVQVGDAEAALADLVQKLRDLKAEQERLRQALVLFAYNESYYRQPITRQMADAKAVLGEPV